MESVTEATFTSPPATHLAILHTLPSHERDEKDSDGSDPSVHPKTNGKHLDGRARHDKGRCSARRSGDGCGGRCL